MRLLKNTILKLVWILSLWEALISQVSSKGSASVCELKKDCGECIQTAGCSWCKNPEFEEEGHRYRVMGRSRCNTMENHKKDPVCNGNFLEIPQSFVNILEKQPLELRQVHISPQKAKVKLAVGDPVTLELEYLEAKDKPLDLYYILDLSYTMLDDKETVAKQSKKLASELGKVTTEVKLGFGSFIDKPIIPYVSEKQLTGRDWAYAKPYGFKNHLSLTGNVEQFETTVKNSKISGNIDSPEGGLEALIQAIVCTDQIGWRNNSRKLIVMATDGGFHIAGDGKIGGVVIPNDLECHLNEKNEYTHSTLHDYPSVGALNHIVTKNKVYVIFAVAASELPLYKSLSSQVSSSKAALLNADSNNVVELVKEQYRTLSSRVKLDRIGYENEIAVTYEVKCKKSDKEWKPSRLCGDVRPEDEIKYKVTLTLQECPKVSDRNKKLIFSTFELKETFAIDIDFVCECNCTKNPLTKISSSEDAVTLNKTCKGNGEKLQCGKCICDKDHTGVNCECSKFSDEDTGNNKTNCIRDGIECSGKGKCECSVCQCMKEGYSGKHCECDDSLCKLSGKLSERDCTGNGKCNCGKCECDDGFGGPKCQCLKEKTTCNEPGSSKSCNGHGQCGCSIKNELVGWGWQCDKCDEGYSGKFCHICRGLGCSNSKEASSRCSDPELIECVQCHLKNEQPDRKDPKIDCNKVCTRKSPAEGDINKYQVTLSTLSDVENNGIRCSNVNYNDTCTMGFSYLYQEGDMMRLTLKVTADISLICRAPTNYFWFLIGVAGGILLVGILTLLLWKLLTHLHDSREYERFEKERAAAKFDTGENPLYNNPMQTFDNPSYRN